MTTAENGQKAIDVLVSPDHAIDLILTDIMMPEVDGMELMKIVQASDNRSIPIIVMSTVDSEEFKTKCGDAGAQDYFVKPLRKSQMADLGRHAASGAASNPSAARCSSLASGAAPELPAAGSGDGGNVGGQSNNSTDTAQGVRGPSPEENNTHDAEELGRGKRSGRVADRMAQRRRQREEAEEAEEAAKRAKARSKAKARAAAEEKNQKTHPKKAGHSPPSDAEKAAKGEGAGGSGSRCGSGGSGSDEPKELEGLSVQLVKAYGGATTMLELTLPKSAAGGDQPKVGLRRSASRSAFQSFLNLEDAAAAQVVSLKVDPEVAARSEGALASLAGIAAVAEEGTGRRPRGEPEEGPEATERTTAPAPAPAAAPAPAQQPAPLNLPVGGMPGMPFPFGMPGMPPNPAMAAAAAAASAGMPLPPHVLASMAAGMHHAGVLGPDGKPAGGGIPGMPPGGPMMPPGAMPPGGMYPPCPPGLDPGTYARNVGAASAAASAAAASAGPAGSSAAATEFISKFYSVLESAVTHQQEQFVRLGASATSAERRAEAIARYLKKRKDRNFEKKVRYASRKRLAEARPRIRGQFVRLKEGEEEGGAAPEGAGEEGDEEEDAKEEGSRGGSADAEGGSNEDGSGEDGSTGADGSNQNGSDVARSAKEHEPAASPLAVRERRGSVPA